MQNLEKHNKVFCAVNALKFGLVPFGAKKHMLDGRDFCGDHQFMHDCKG